MKKLFHQNWLLILLLIFSLTIRFWYLAQVKELIFDEFYFVNFAKNYLNHVPFFDIHPPLGKLIIASAIKILGDGPLSWRIMSAIFGTFFIYLVYLTGQELVDKKTGLLAVFLATFDGMFLVYSRTGLMDIFLIFFIILSFYSFLKFSHTQKTPYLLIAGISLGLASSIKYIGFGLYGLLIGIYFIKKIPFDQNKWKFLIYLIIIPLLIYFLIFLFNFPLKTLIIDVYNWQKYSLKSNIDAVNMYHPYQSKWWTWLFLYRPVCLYFETLSNGKYMAMYALGNPFIWWSALLSLPFWFWLVIKKNQNSLILLVGFLVFLLPWALVKRSLFIYHAIPSFSFLILNFAIILRKFLKFRIGQWIVLIYILITIAWFCYFLPFWLAIPLDSADFYRRMLLKSWI